MADKMSANRMARPVPLFARRLLRRVLNLLPQKDWFSFGGQVYWPVTDGRAFNVTFPTSSQLSYPSRPLNIFTSHAPVARFRLFLTVTGRP